MLIFIRITHLLPAMGNFHWLNFDASCQVMLIHQVIRNVPNRDDFVKLSLCMVVDDRLDLLVQGLGFVLKSAYLPTLKIAELGFEITAAHCTIIHPKCLAVSVFFLFEEQTQACWRTASST